MPYIAYDIDYLVMYSLVVPQQLFLPPLPHAALPNRSESSHLLASQSP